MDSASLFLFVVLAAKTIMSKSSHDSSRKNRAMGQSTSPHPPVAGRLGMTGRLSRIRDGNDRDRPNRDRSASDGDLHPTNGGTRSSSARALRVTHGDDVPLACCTSRVARWLHAACSLPWRYDVGTYSRGLHGQKRAALPRMQTIPRKPRRRATTFARTFSLP